MLGPLLVALAVAFHTSSRRRQAARSGHQSLLGTHRTRGGPVSDTYGRRRVGLTGLLIMAVGFVVENRFSRLNFTLQRVMPRVARHLSRARGPGWGSPPPREQGMEVQRRWESIRVSQNGAVTTPPSTEWPGRILNVAVGIIGLAVETDYVSRAGLLNSCASRETQGERSCLQEMDASGDAGRLMSDYEGL